MFTSRFWLRSTYRTILFAQRYKAERRKQQNYQSFPKYLTDPLWHALQSQPKEKATSMLLPHLWALGLRCPSEGTFAVLQNLLTLVTPHAQPMTTFEKYQALQGLKKAWKKFKAVCKDEDAVYTEYMETLPANPADLPAEYLLAAFSEHEIVPCRASAAQLHRFRESYQGITGTNSFQLKFFRKQEAYYPKTIFLSNRHVLSYQCIHMYTDLRL